MTNQHSSSEWERVTLQHCCFRPEYGYTASASEKQFGPRFLRITDIQNGEVDWDRVPHVEKPDEVDDKYFLEAGDIVIARIGATTGKAYLIQECPEAIFASYLIRIRTRPGLLPKFLNYCLQTSQYWQHINSQKGGRLKGGVNIPILENLEIPYPTPVEQAAVVQALDAVQEASKTRRRELALETERKAALMEYLFTHGTRGEPTKRTEIGEIPESWEVLDLGRAVKFKSGESRPDDLTEMPKGDRVVPVYGGNGVMGFTSRVFSRDTLLVVGRVGAYCGCVHIAPSPNWITDNALYSSQFLRDVSLEFLAVQLEYKDLNRLKRKAAQPLVTQSVLHGISIFLPSSEEQHEIAESLRTCSGKILACQREMTFLDELFLAMLEELMNGRLSTVPLIEEQQLR